jgi:DNA-directed RNA polymerase subunit E'/Rpb7
MITMKEWMAAVNYRITEGSEYYQDEHRGPLYALDYWNQDHDGHSTTIVFDPKTSEVLEATVHDFKKGLAYRITTFNIVDRQAWDEVDYVDLELDEDFIEKMTAILNGEEVDTRIMVELNLSESQIFTLMQMAHEQDMTLNKFVEKLLRSYIEKMK